MGKPKSIAERIAAHQSAGDPARARTRRRPKNPGKPKPWSGAPPGTEIIAREAHRQINAGTWTQDVNDRIVRFVQNGCYVETAFRAAGVGRATYYKWLKRGANGREPYATMVLQIEAAMAIAEQRLADSIDFHAQHDWRAAAWKLERMHPKKYGQHITVNAGEGNALPQPDGGAMDLSKLSREELLQLKSLTAKARGDLPEDLEIIDVEPEAAE